MTWLEWLATVAGLLLTAGVVRDVFNTLMHPSGAGALSPRLFRIVRSLLGRRHHLAPPLGVVSTIATWAGGLVLGFALIYWPHLPEGFVLTDGLRPTEQEGIVDALYVSGVALVTLGFGDIVAEASALRMALVLEALIGFGLLTASIAWVLSIYPALTRSRALAASITAILDTSDGQRLLGGDSPASVAIVLHDLAAQIATVRVDLIEYPSSYFFQPPARDLSLPVALPRLHAALASKRIPVEAHGAAEVLRASIDRFAQELSDGSFGWRADGTQQALRAYADDQGVTPAAGASRRTTRA